MRVELDEATDELRHSAHTIEGLDQALNLCQQQISKCAVKLQKQSAEADAKLAERRQVLHK